MAVATEQLDRGDSVLPGGSLGLFKRSSSHMDEAMTSREKRSDNHQQSIASSQMQIQVCVGVQN